MMKMVKYTNRIVNLEHPSMGAGWREYPTPVIKQTKPVCLIDVTCAFPKITRSIWLKLYGIVSSIHWMDLLISSSKCTLATGLFKLWGRIQLNINAAVDPIK